MWLLSEMNSCRCVERPHFLHYIVEYIQLEFTCILLLVSGVFKAFNILVFWDPNSNLQLSNTGVKLLQVGRGGFTTPVTPKVFTSHSSHFPSQLPLLRKCQPEYSMAYKASRNVSRFQLDWPVGFVHFPLWLRGFLGNADAVWNVWLWMPLQCGLEPGYIDCETGSSAGWRCLCARDVRGKRQGWTVGRS